LSQIIKNLLGGPIPPQIPTEFVANLGSATPAGNILNTLGAGSITSIGSGNTITYELTGLTANSVLYGQGTATIGLVAPGTTGQVLTAVTGLPPVWASPAPGTSIIGTANQVLANGTSGVGQTGAVTLTTPQDIATTSTPTFSRVFAGQGTAGAPGFSFTGATDSGLSTDATNTYISGAGFATGSFGFNVTLSGGINTITKGFLLSGIDTQTANFTTAYNKYLYLVDVTTGGAAITAQLVSSPITGQVYTFKDSTGAAATHNITISGTISGVNIDGATTLVINVNYGVARLIYNGTQWNQI
jgi:hypothetical protein